MMGSILSSLTGLCAGLVTGAALCAFYIALGVFSKSAISLGANINATTMAIYSASGGVFGTVITIFDVSIYIARFWSGIFGLLAGIYVGIFIGCLAEVTNSIPVIKNLGVSSKYIALILLIFVAGKMLGSIIYWISGAFY